MTRLFDRSLAAWGCALLLALFATVLAGVVTRATGDPLSWTDEGARFLMVWLACCGAMLASRRHAHVRIRYFQGLLPARLGRIVAVVMDAATGVLGLALTWFAITLVRRNASLEATSLPLAMAWLYVPLLPLGALVAAQAVADLLDPTTTPLPVQVRTE